MKRIVFLILFSMLFAFLSTRASSFQAYAAANCELHCEETVPGCQDGDGAAIEINSGTAFANHEVLIIDKYVDKFGTSYAGPGDYVTLDANGDGNRSLGILEESRNGHEVTVCDRTPGPNQICNASSSDFLCTTYVASTVVTPAPTTSAYDPRCGPDGDRSSAVRTALGCLPTSPQAFVNIAIPWAIFLGSGVAFLLGLYGVLMIVVSAGNPEKMQAGRELITSAITGLLIIIFAVFILKVVGVDILKLFFWKEQQVWQ